MSGALEYQTIGPYADGSCFVVYRLPGTSFLSIVCECRNEDQAEYEASRLRDEQTKREDAIRHERELCGLATEQ